MIFFFFFLHFNPLYVNRPLLFVGFRFASETFPPTSSPSESASPPTVALRDASLDKVVRHQQNTPVYTVTHSMLKTEPKKNSTHQGLKPLFRAMEIV